MLFPITIFPCVPFAPDIFLLNESAETESSCPLGDFVHGPPLGSGPHAPAQNSEAQAALSAFPGRIVQDSRSWCWPGPWVCGSVHKAIAPGPLSLCGAWAYGPRWPQPASPHDLSLWSGKGKGRPQATLGQANRTSHYNRMEKSNRTSGHPVRLG